MSTVTYASGDTETIGIALARRVLPCSFPDPFVWKVDDVWFAIATGRSGDGRAFPMLSSTDFVNWAPLPGAMLPVEGVGEDYWAPEVAQINGVWTLFYSVGLGDKGHHLRMATSDRPEGPYFDSERPILDPRGCPFAIDAHPYEDEKGRWWLFYARDLLDGPRPGTSIVVAPLGGDLSLPEDFQVVARADSDWQIYARNREIYGRSLNWHTLEGPSTVKRDGVLYLFYSGGNWTNATYGVDWLTAPGVEGPWRSERVETPRLLRSGGPLIGPGHNSFVEGPDGETWTAFHAWNEARTQREMWLARVCRTESEK